MEIKNKVVIVTGASSGIGLATAKLLTKLGAKVTLVSRSQEKLEKISRTLPDSFVVICDMTKENQIKEMVRQVQKHYGRIDILINNAGQGYDATIENIDNKTFRQVFDLNVVGPLLAMQQVIPIMKKQGNGSIVNISSGLALMSIPGMSGYSSLKRALVGLSLTAREELKSENINVGVVYPYMTNTNFEKNTIKHHKIKVEENDGDYELPKADSADFVAKKIVEAITSEKAEIFAHDWFKNLSK